MDHSVGGHGGQGGKTGEKGDGESRQQDSSVPHANLLV
jgi:hypothetical protein